MTVCVAGGVSLQHDRVFAVASAPLNRVDASLHAQVEELTVRRVPALEEECHLRLNLVHDASHDDDVQNASANHLLDTCSVSRRMHVKIEAIVLAKQRRGGVPADADPLIA